MACVAGDFFTLDTGLFWVCFGGVVCVGFAGSAGFKGDFDEGFSSTSCVDRPAAEIITTIISNDNSHIDCI